MGELEGPEGTDDHVVRAREWLENRTGDQRPTINDVAAISGVSKKTVSRVINGSPLLRDTTRKQVEAVIQTIGYVPDPQARGLALRHAFLVGLLYDNPNPQYVVNMQEGILGGLRGTGFELLVHRCDRSNPDFVQEVRGFIERQRLFGVIVTPSLSEDANLAKLMADMQFPSISIASVRLHDQPDMIVTNDEAGGYMAGQHLADLGHTRFAFISGRPRFESWKQRLKGFRAAIEERGLELPESAIIGGDFTFGSGVEAGEKFLGTLPDVTAVFAANDAMAVGFMQALNAAGKSIPEDVSVVGFDDFEVARMAFPQLTTLHAPTGEVGAMAASRLLELHGGKEKSAGRVDHISPWLITRGTTRRISG